MLERLEVRPVRIERKKASKWHLLSKEGRD